MQWENQKDKNSKWCNVAYSHEQILKSYFRFALEFQIWTQMTPASQNLNLF